MNDKALWKVFSQYIRLRDSDENGICKCFTCGRPNHWTKMDAGHGLGRQRLAIKYSEKNVHAQCGHCNLDGGRQDVYKIEVDKKYGKGTWNRLELAGRSTFRWGQFEINLMKAFYQTQVEKLKKEKGVLL